MKYYAVKIGRKTGIFTSWEEALESVHGFKGAVYKSFVNEEDACAYLNDTSHLSKPKKLHQSLCLNTFKFNGKKHLDIEKKPFLIRGAIVLADSVMEKGNSDEMLIVLGKTNREYKYGMLFDGLPWASKDGKEWVLALVFGSEIE